MLSIRTAIICAAALAVGASGALAQSYYDDDIYYNPSKATKKTAKETPAPRRTTVIVADYPAADSYTVAGTRSISVDDYNRRGLWAADSLSTDTVAPDFGCTRRIEKFYNPSIVSGSSDQELANIYYMEPERVNIYVNTPSPYWGYDYFNPAFAWYTPWHWDMAWRWNSPWYWDSWYYPGWAWGPSWTWGYGWGYRPAWGWGASWGWGPSWGWAPSWGGSHGHTSRPAIPSHRPTTGAWGRPGTAGSGHASGGRQSVTTTNGGRYQPSGRVGTQASSRPGYTATGRGQSAQTSRGSQAGSRQQGTVQRQQSTNGGRTGSGSQGYNQGSGYSRSSSSWGGQGGGYSSGGGRSGSYSGGSSGGRSSAGGRGRH